MATPERKAPETAAEHLQKTHQYVQLWRLNLRIEYLFLGAIFSFAIAIAAGVLAFDLGENDITGSLGYPMLWVISLLRASSVLIPVPGSGLTLAAGALMEPVWGLPVPLTVGLTVGSAESLGEFTGYAAGRSGGRLLEGRRLYEWVKRSIRRRAFTTMFVLSLAPSPVFDVGGLAAGAARLPVRVFYPAVLIGKVLRGIALAAAGLYGVELVGHVF